MKHEIELKMIKDYVDKCAGYDISDKRRDAEIVKFRTLYFKLAKQTTHWSLQKIADMVNRNHATVLHAQNKLFAEISKDRKMIKLYRYYKKVILKHQESQVYEDECYNKLQNKYNQSLIQNESLNQMLRMDGLTENEMNYRQLEFKEKESYDERAALVLKSFKWKARNEEAELIIGSPNVSDARGVR
tara:strand:+ start:480 stop:1040 length:561 start_codon:yes stop_codon:yes gene_type:complete